jgi:competence protein ComEC
MTPSKILFFLCISLILGIFIQSIVKIPQIFLWAFLFINFSAIIIFLIIKKDILLITCFCLLFLVIGIMRFQISEFNIKNDKISKFNGKGQVVLTGIIYNEPDVRDTYQMLKIKAGNSIILATTNRYPEYKYLDKVKITGKLQTPGETGDGAVSGSYKNYLMKDGIYSAINFPKIEIVSQKHQYNILSFLYEKILFVKEKIRASIQHNFLPPQSSILEGTILGDNGAMTADLKNKLNITGLRHVIAVSGTHVVILSSIIMSLLLALGLWRGQAFYIAIIFICVYIALTGLPSSGVRAGIMGGLYLFAQKIGRQSVGPRVIVIACAVMLLINPLLLFYDVGFQLSFLAVLGLIYLEPLIKFFIKKLTLKKAENLVSIVSATFAAQIFTLPVMIYNFGNISFIAPITNLLILPIVYWLMVFGFLASVAGIFSNALAWALSVPCWILLKYFVWVIDFFSQPWAMKTLQNIHWFWLVILYMAIVSITGFFNRKYRQKIIQ